MLRQGAAIPRRPDQSTGRASRSRRHGHARLPTRSAAICRLRCRARTGKIDAAGGRLRSRRDMAIWRMLRNRLLQLLALLSALGPLCVSAPAQSQTQNWPTRPVKILLPFDPFKDFTHVAFLGGQPTVTFVSRDLPQKTLPEFVAYAKAHPGEFTYATISYGSQTQLVSEMLQREAGIKMTYVPYRGANLIVNDVLGGHLTMGSLALSAASGQLKAGTLRGLGIGTEERVPAYPDIPTFKELGYPSLVSSTWFGLSGPANLPPQIVERLNAEVVKAMHAPDVEARLEHEAIETKSLSAAGYTAFIKDEMVRWTPIAKAVAEQAKAAGMAPP